jgi:hypothetical protein
MGTPLEGLIEHHAIKTYEGPEVLIHVFLTPGIAGDVGSASCLGALPLRQESHLYTGHMARMFQSLELWKRDVLPCLE